LPVAVVCAVLNLLHFRGGGAPAAMELAVEMHPW